MQLRQKHSRNDKIKCSNLYVSKEWPQKYIYSNFGLFGTWTTKLLTSKIRKMSNIHKCIKVDFKEKSFVTLCSKNHAFNQLDKEGLPDQF